VCLKEGEMSSTWRNHGWGKIAGIRGATDTRERCDEMRMRMSVFSNRIVRSLNSELTVSCHF